MRHLFSTKIIVILVVAAVLAAGLGVWAGITNQTPLQMVAQGLMTPVRSVGNALTRTAEKYYSYMFRYEALSAENEALQAKIAQMEAVSYTHLTLPTICSV